jgi:ethanolamine utilization microcompartment shell protein EutS
MADKAFIVKNGLIVNTNLIYTSGSNVGIMTTTPGATLAVHGNISATANIQVGSVNINTSMVTVSTSNVMTYATTLKVYYANNTIAFPT